MDDDRYKLDDLPELGRVKPRLRGRGLVLPPLAAIAGAAGIILGLAVGLALGPVGQPAQSAASATPFAAPAVVYTPVLVYAPTPLPVEVDVTTDPLSPIVGMPPPGGLPLDKALALLYSYDPTISATDIISASVGNSIAPPLISGETATERWTWTFLVRRDGSTSACDDSMAPLPIEPSGLVGEGVTRDYRFHGGVVCALIQTEVYQIDYLTGALLETTVPTSVSVP